jgi:tetratricopeptide (TPR) repeat protein
MQALTRLLLGQARDKPVLLVYEDLHWVDPTSLELLDLLLDAIADQTIMILATARPSFDYGFGGHPIVTRFALNRLGKDQVGAIVSKLTCGKVLPDEIMEIIAQRTDGVPLFVEELTKTILESGALEEDGDQLVLNGPLSAIAIPTTLHDSLMARLDRLQPIKEVAQTAACVGREFSHGLLARVSHLPEAELSKALDGLIAAELIYRRGLPPEATYLFKHALVRDAAYGSLLKDKRRALHNRILAELEVDPDIAPEVLAVHAEEAGLTGRAIDLWEAAGKAAISRPAYDEGIAHLGRAISLIEPKVQEGDTSATEHALSMQVQRGMAYLTRLGHGAEETVSAFEMALALADKVGETPMRYSILYGLWIGKGVRGEHAKAWPRAETLIEQAALSVETAPLVVAHRVAGATLGFMGDFAGAIGHLDIALQNYDPSAHAGLADRFGQDIGVSVNIFAALNTLLTGQTRRARKHVEDAERIAKATGHIQTICYALSIRSLISLLERDTETAARCIMEVMPIVEEHKLAMWQYFGSMIREVVAAGNGDQNSIARYLKADADLVATKVRMFVPQLRINAAWGALELGLRDEAARLAAMARDLIDQTGEKYALSDLHRLQASLARADGGSGTAESHLNTALEIAREQGAKLWELRAALDLAKLRQEQVRIDEAVSLLRSVHDSIDDEDCPTDLAMAQELLAEMAG